MIKINWIKFIHSYMWFGFYFDFGPKYRFDVKENTLTQVSTWQISNRIQDRFTPMRKYD